MEKIKKIIEILDKINVRDLKVYETKTVTPFFDYIIISTVSSNRQLSAAASNIKDECEENGYYIRGIEGANGGEWSLVDMGDLIIHVFTKEAREFYDLDRLFKNLPELEL